MRSLYACKKKDFLNTEWKIHEFETSLASITADVAIEIIFEIGAEFIALLIAKTSFSIKQNIGDNIDKRWFISENLYTAEHSCVSIFTLPI